jgi:hypothetical protein
MDEMKMDRNLETDHLKDPDASSFEEVTLEPTSHIERNMDFREAEYIENAFNTLMDSILTDNHVGATESDIKVPLPADQALPHARVAKIDSFTWKLDIVKDEVGQFRVPTKHSAGVIAQETDGVLDRPLEQIPKMIKIEDDPLTHPGPFDAEDQSDSDEPDGFQDMDTSEVAFLVMQSAQEDIEEDIAAISDEIEAMSEAKSKIRESLTVSFNESEPIPSEIGEDSPLISNMVPGDHVAMPDNDGMVSSEDVGSSSEHEIKYEASPAYTIDPESGVVHFGDGDVGEKPPTGVSISAHYEGSGDPGSQDRPDDGYDDSSLKEEDKESRDEDNPRDASNDTDSNGEREPPSDRSNR